MRLLCNPYSIIQTMIDFYEEIFYLELTKLNKPAVTKRLIFMPYPFPHTLNSFPVVCFVVCLFALRECKLLHCYRRFGMKK